MREHADATAGDRGDVLGAQLDQGQHSTTTAVREPLLAWDSELLLTIGDAARACGYEMARYGPDTPIPLLDDFDPADIPRLFLEDYAIEHYDRAPLFARPPRKMSDGELAAHLRALRNAAKLPLVPAFCDAIAALVPQVEAEARRRLNAARVRRERAARDSASGRPSFAEIKAHVRLEDEVEAVAGPPRRSGLHLRFHCPLHPPDRSCDFAVTPGLQLWRDFHDGAHGDVIDFWRLVGRRIT